MKISASVAGENYEIPEPSLSDLVAFERHFATSSAVFSPPDEGEEREPTRIEWIAFLVYRGLIRLGVFEKSATFDYVLDQIEDFDMEDDDEDEDGDEGKG